MIGRHQRRLRALFDVNVLISALLSPHPQRSAAAAVLVAAEAGSFLMVIPVETLEEMNRVISEKSWLAARISPEAAMRFGSDLRRIAEIAPRLDHAAPRVSRDPGDDYLLAQAVLAQVDVLVTRDRDPLDLGTVAGIQIVDPESFMHMLRSRFEPN